MSIQDDECEDRKTGKTRKPLSSGLERLKAPMAAATKELVHVFTKSDIKNDPDLVINLEREEDKDIDIE